MQAYWINFATQGYPNSGGLTRCAPYGDKRNLRAMQMGDRAELAAEPDAAKLAFYQGWYDCVAHVR